MNHLGSLSDNLPNDHLDVRRRRLLFRCWHSGTQEIDLILGPFAEAFLADLGTVQLEQFEALLACPDPDLLDWIVNGIAPPPEHDHDVMQLLRGFCTERHCGPRQIGQHRI